jgi:regulatory protein
MRKRAEREPDQQSVDDNPQADPVQVARSIALRQLTMGPRSRAQLAQAMAKRDVPVDAADAVLDRFEELGLINDSDLAHMIVRSRHATKGVARRALAQELRNKGIAQVDAEGALESLTVEMEEQSARELVRRKLRTMGSVTPDAQARRLIGMLARKGYPSGMVMAVVRSELASAGSEIED